MRARAARIVFVPSLVLAVAAVWLGAAPGAGAADAIHATLKDFGPTGKYVFESQEGHGKPPRVYYSQRAAAYLVRGTPLGGGLLLRTGASAVESVPDESIVQRADGACDLKADVKPKPLGTFTVEGPPPQIVVNVEGLHGRLKPAPPLLGWQKQANLVYHTPEYARDAKAFTPDAAGIEAIRCDPRKIQVFVYFGSWCPTCQSLLGRILRLENEITKDRPQVTFDYYGLPPVEPHPGMYEDEQVRTYGIEKIPTGLVYVDDQPVGKIVGLDWRRPEAALRAVLGR
jgi:thiol-disulfide isomerase/thioredoxin